MLVVRVRDSTTPRNGCCQFLGGLDVEETPDIAGKFEEKTRGGLSSNSLGVESEST